MKVLQVSESRYEIVEVDEPYYWCYRRHSADNWEVLMGESWEPHYFTDEIEKAYQEYKESQAGNNK